MNEAPKKIWMNDNMTAWEQYSEDDTPYIRADIVDELVEALKCWMNLTGYSYMRPSYMRSEAALAKLEEIANDD
jgi:hypothetical protein